MTLFAYVGSFTTPDRQGHGDGINVYRVDPQDGSWTHVQHVACFDNPSYLRLGPDGDVLFAVHGARTSVSAFAIAPGSGALRFIDRAETGGENPVDLGFGPAGRSIVVAHYTSGTVSVLPVAEDGRIGMFTQSVRLTGTPGPRTADQTGPLPHGVTPDPGGRFLIVPDKGLDRIFVFGFDGQELVKVAEAAATPGSGPRHAVFHPSLPMLYVVCELNASIDVFRWHAATGGLELAQCVSALPPGIDTTSLGAEIAVSPAGDCVYSSNRGHDSIARFRVDPRSGLLTWQDCTPTLGQEPRSFAIDPTGERLHVANQASDTIVSFPRDPEGGRLGGGVVTARTGTPVAICFSVDGTQA